MQRIVCPERDDWRQTAAQCGCAFHTIDGERYWDERAYYAFTLDEIERVIDAPADQFNSIHGRLIEAWKQIAAGRHVHLTGTTGNEEDAGTLAYLEDTARQAGLTTTLLDIAEIGWRDEGGGFVDLDDSDIA